MIVENNYSCPPKVYEVKVLIYFFLIYEIFVVLYTTLHL